MKNSGATRASRGPNRSTWGNPSPWGAGMRGYARVALRDSDRVAAYPSEHPSLIRWGPAMLVARQTPLLLPQRRQLVVAPLADPACFAGSESQRWLIGLTLQGQALTPSTLSAVCIGIRSSRRDVRQNPGPAGVCSTQCASATGKQLSVSQLEVLDAENVAGRGALAVGGLPVADGGRCSRRPAARCQAIRRYRGYPQTSRTASGGRSDRFLHAGGDSARNAAAELIPSSGPHAWQL